jgi:hypothetical protein
VKAPRPGRCLGDRIADLADGRLGPAVAERAYAHVAVCTRCRAALEAQREVRSRLAQSADPADGAEGDLMSRLRGIAATPASTAIPAQPTAGRTPAGAAGVRPGSGSGSASTRPAGARRRHRTRIAIASAAGAAALVVVAAVGGGSSAVSGPARPAPSIAPVVDRLTDAHESSADQMPFSGPRIVTAAFSAPSGSSSPQP